ncbi:MAG: LytR family transcriptional regulator [Propionibacteriaceae bacterium]|nr:LytR family transcriptional regulator [Propionibacteriaceae bacterium]
MSDNSAPPETSSRPPAPRRRKRRVLPKVLIGIAVVLVLALAAGAVYVFSIDRSLTNNLNRADNMPPETPTEPGQSPRPAVDPAADGALNFVLLGSDSRDTSDSGSGRSDSIILVHLNKKRDKAYLVSFPRDMWVTVPGHGKNKINAAFAFGGPPLTVRTLEGITGARMDHVVLVDFEGFIDLTDTLGGVTVTNDNKFSSHGFDYPKGEITIQGKQALWFVRERHNLPNGDLDRAKNQRKVVQAIVRKGLSPEVISNPVKFNDFISGVAQHLVVDQQLSDSEIRSTALSLRLTGSDVNELQAPISGFGTSSDGQSIDVVDESKMKELGTALRKDTMEDYVKKYPDE